MPVTDVQRDYDALTLTITAEFEADAERVWELWADPRQLEAWWSPPSHTSTFVEHELKPGAVTTYFMTDPEGEKHHGRWRIEEVDPPRRLRLSDDEVDEDGRPEDGGPTGFTVTIAEAGGTATMSIESHFFDRELMKQGVEMGFEEGLTLMLNQLDSSLGAARV